MAVQTRARVTKGKAKNIDACADDRGIIRIGAEVGPGDVIYVAGDELHCFEAIGDEPLGFICVIPPR